MYSILVVDVSDIYFRLRYWFGKNNKYLFKVRNLLLWRGEFYPQMCTKSIRSTKSESD